MCSHYIIIPFIRWNIWYIEHRLFIVNIEFLHMFCHACWANGSFKPNWNMLVPGIFHPAMPHLRFDIIGSLHRYTQKLTRCKLTRCIGGIGESLHGGRRAKSILHDMNVTFSIPTILRHMTTCTLSIWIYLGYPYISHMADSTYFVWK